jgi:hypothetical protein
MAPSVRAQHHATEPTALATALYLGLCLLALTLMASAADLLGTTPHRSDTVLRAPSLRYPAGSPLPVGRDAERAPVQPTLPRLQLRSHAAPASSRTAPTDGGGVLAALRALAAEGRLPAPLAVDAAAQESASPREALADAGPLALPGESDGINVRRGSDSGGAERLGELVTSGAQEVSYGPKPTPSIDLDAGGGELAALSPAGGAPMAPLTAG